MVLAESGKREIPQVECIVIGYLFTHALKKMSQVENVLKSAAHKSSTEPQRNELTQLIIHMQYTIQSTLRPESENQETFPNFLELSGNEKPN